MSNDKGVEDEIFRFLEFPTYSRGWRYGRKLAADNWSLLSPEVKKKVLEERAYPRSTFK